MQQAIPYSNGRTWFPLSSPTAVCAILTGRPSLDGQARVVGSSGGGVGDVKSMVAEIPVLVVGRKGCCMCHVVRRLLLGLGVNPAVFELDEDREDAALVEEKLKGLVGRTGGDGGSAGFQFPAVFIGGRHVGGLDRLMAIHISGDLVPILKEAGALWL